MFNNSKVCKSCAHRVFNTWGVVRYKSHYDVLGVSPKATQKEIREAFIKLSKEAHPDQNTNKKDSHDKFVKINESYDVLKKDSTRAEYDKKIGISKSGKYPYSQQTFTQHYGPNYYSSGEFYRDHHRHWKERDTGAYGPYANQQRNSKDPFGFYHYQQSQRSQETRDKQRSDHEFRAMEMFRLLVRIDIMALVVAGLVGLLTSFQIRDRHIHEEIKQGLQRRNQLREERINSADRSKGRAHAEPKTS